MRQSDKARIYKRDFIQKIPYKMCHYKQFDYSILDHIYTYISIKNGCRTTYNDVIIMADTETSKSQPDESYVDNKGRIKYNTYYNYVVAWTISIRAFNHNIVTLYGRKPSTMIETLQRIHDNMNGQKTLVFFHNLGYDHIFLRKFAWSRYGNPIKQLNTKPYYPIQIEYGNGLVFRDSLILAQRKLEKWADDLNVEHKKSVGKWDYEKLRHQDATLTPFTNDELEYIEHDTLAGVECLDATCDALNKKIYTLPLTATGIPREQIKKLGGAKAHDLFLKIAPNYDQYIKLTKIYHGGFTHGNRHYLNTCLDASLGLGNVKCFDFASSYPYCLLSGKYPCENFTPYKNCSADFVLENMDKYAFMFKFVAVNVKLKDDSVPMPTLQYSKAVKVINPLLDNGRILACNYIEVYLNEWDLRVISSMYSWERHACIEVETARKDYLPRWFTDYVYQCFVDKCYLKGGDPILYSIAKSKLNALYGITVEHCIRDEINEDYDTGKFIQAILSDPREEYNKYINRRSSMLPYFIGCWVTSMAFYNVIELSRCCDLPLYIDTDSCYGYKWNNDKLTAYNNACKEKLLKNGYGAVNINGREFWLGVAEFDGEYTEYKFMGAKRYCGRNADTGDLKITVAGVPKKAGAKCLNNDINSFAPGFIFSGLQTGKRTHTYIFNDIQTDSNGNEYADSISLVPCDYELDAVTDVDWETLFKEDINIQYDLTDD